MEGFFVIKMLGFFLDEKAIIHVCHLGKCTLKLGSLQKQIALLLSGCLLN